MTTSVSPPTARFVSVQAPKRPLPNRWEVLLALALTVFLLTSLGWLLATTVFSHVEPSLERRAEVAAAFLPDLQSTLKPEPLERWLFITLTLASPFCVALAIAASRKILQHSIRLSVPLTRLLFCIAGATIGFGGLHLLHGNSILAFYFFPDATPDFVAMGLAFVAIPLLAKLGWRDKHRLLFWTLVVLCAAITILPRGRSVYSALGDEATSKGCWDVHFQAVGFPLTQLYAGKPLIEASPPLYGYYAQFLLPIFQAIGLSLLKFCLVMAGLIIIAQTAILWVAWRFIRNRALFVLFATSLIYTSCGTWAFRTLPFDPYFQYWPVRVLLPALSLPLFLWVIRRQTLLRLTLLGIFAGLSLVWNTESGIAVVGAMLFALGCMLLVRFKQRSSLQIGHVALPLPVAGLTVAAFWWYLHAQAPGAHPIHTTAEYQRIFYESGFAMMPLPTTAHPWQLVILAYLIGLIFAIRQFWRAIADPFSHLCAYTSVLGLGLFTYYQGRSHDYNLVNVCWPSILLAFIFTDRLLRSVRAGKMPAEIQLAGLPVFHYAISAIILGYGTLGSLATQGIAHWKAAFAAQPDALTSRIEFIRNHVGSDRSCTILAHLQAVYYAETGFRSDLNAPGRTELFFLSDTDYLRKILKQHPSKHLFVDAKVLEELDLSDTIKANYHPISPSPDSALTYLEPNDSR